MRRSPRRPLILKRRKLPFQLNEGTVSRSETGEPCVKEPARFSSSRTFPDGIRIMDHPSMSGTQVVVIPKTADLQSVIGALTAKGKESGTQGPNKFILLSGNDSQGNKSSTQFRVEADGTSNRTSITKPVNEKPMQPSGDAKKLTGLKPLSKDGFGGPIDESLTNIQWLGKMNTCGLELNSSTHTVNKENQTMAPKASQTHGPRAPAEASQQPVSERPPYSYMAMIQFAINGGKDRKMTLKEIYTWIEDHFPYYRDVAKPGWKNSVRHNLSLHDMFIREMSPDEKTSFWTIRPEANRCLTLDHVYQPGCDPMTTPVTVPMLVFPHQHQKMLPDVRKTPTGYGPERRMKPLLPRTDSYLLPIQLPVTPALYLPSPPTPFPSTSAFQPKRSTPRAAKRVRIAPKVGQNDSSVVSTSLQTNKVVKVQVKEEEQLCFPITETPKVTPKRQVSSSRRKQHLVRSLHEEPVLLCPDNTFFDSGMASDASTLHDVRDTELLDDHQDSPDRHFSFKTPIKSSSQLTSSTPSKPACSVAPEPWKVTPVGKKSQGMLDFSPIRTPNGPPVTPRQDYSTHLSFSSTSFTDYPLFNSPSELLTSTSRVSRGAEPTSEHAPLMAGASTSAVNANANHSLTEGLVLDAMNESLSKVFVDVSFSGLDEEEFDMNNISWSEFFPQLK